jgi:putative transposase
MKGKSAVSIARNYLGKQKGFTGENFWARGYYVSTVDLDKEIITAYIRKQEAEDKRIDNLALF